MRRMFERVNDAAGTAATLHALRHTAAYRMAGLGCRPIRDLLVSYLHERQPSLDYNSLKDLSYYLARRFWKDLEVHHPGIDSLRLTPEVAAGWRERLLKKQPSRSGARDRRGLCARATSTWPPPRTFSRPRTSDPPQRQHDEPVPGVVVRHYFLGSWRLLFFYPRYARLRQLVFYPDKHHCGSGGNDFSTQN
jgi:hypothetical protein